ncbi:MAG: GIY-YIG nuclease family protein [Anaerolineales bacterium]|nr:GIY-YIG nuclease family protein [Anaerolineales bacterium]
MKAYTVTEILNQATDSTLGHLIYLVRDSKLVLYIGQSKRDVRTRFQEHIQKPSLLGKLIQANLPASHHWSVEFYTLADCRPFIPQKTLFPMQAWEHFDMDMAEKAMIQTFHPVVNKDFNPSPTPLPAHYKGHDLLEETQTKHLPEFNPQSRIWMNKMSLHGWTYIRDPQTNELIWHHPDGYTISDNKIDIYRQAGQIPPSHNK